MGIISEEQVLTALRGVLDEGRDADIVSLGMVSGIRIDPDNNVFFLIQVDPERGSHLEPLRQRAEKAVAAIEGVESVSSVLTAERGNADSDNNMADAPRGGQGAQSGHMATGRKKPEILPVPAKNIILVGSGKGGVGKSTVACNLAVFLSKFSQLKGGRLPRVGMLDADIYGPSIPKLLGLEDYEPKMDENEKIIPAQGHGMKVMSIGFMVEKERALIWRGPMMQSALFQMLRDVAWADTDAKGAMEPLDYLIIDLPPGTGDVQLTLAQRVAISGAVIVSTPQDIALIDARRAYEMFQKTNVPVLGVIENMSTFICPHCGNKTDIFGHNGAREEAEKLGVPFLGGIPLTADIRLKSDEGRPIVVAQPESSPAQAFANIVEKLIAAPG